MPFFLPLLFLAQGYDPEIEAVMNRSRKEKQEAAAAATAAAPKPAAAREDGRIPVPAKYAAPFQACLDQAIEAPDAGVAFAQKWRIDGGSFYARHCMGFAYARAERWGPAIVAFEQAAEEAERSAEMAQSARLWAQAGNAALASGDAAKARGYREGENPARWRGHIAQILPARSRLTRGHHKAMSYEAISAFVGALRKRKAVAALALEFTILTAARTGEVIGATWDEVELDKAIWTVPASRMKAGKEHRVPLSPRAVEILKSTQGLRKEWMFPAIKGGKMSGM